MDENELPNNSFNNLLIENEQHPLKIVLENSEVKNGINSIANFIDQLSENSKLSKEIEKLKVENELAVENLDYQKNIAELDNKDKVYIHIKGFDTRNKIYTYAFFVTSLLSIWAFTYFGIIDKSDAKTIFIMIVSIGITSNADFLKNLFTKSSED